MTDPRSTLQRSLALPLLLIGLGLAVLPALWPVGAMAVLGPWLAQRAVALGMARLARAPPEPGDGSVESVEALQSQTGSSCD